ncbi:MAG: helix-turn-helix domain-containing protein [Planctomycetota bacterium]|nr:helix-turn-helix domain-containing protein [Planctomycetota bacterium]
MEIRSYARSHLVNAWRRKPSLLEVYEVAALVRVTERTVRRWITDGNLAAVDKGFKGALVPKSSLIDFMCGELPDDDDQDLIEIDDKDDLADKTGRI